MPETIETKTLEFGRHASPGSWFLSKASEIEGRPELLPYSHYLRQAWSEISLSGVLCVDGRPAVYLCEGVRFTQEQKRERHRFVWNQGLVHSSSFSPRTGSRSTAPSRCRRKSRWPADSSIVIYPV